MVSQHLGEPVPAAAPAPTPDEVDDDSPPLPASQPADSSREAPDEDGDEDVSGTFMMDATCVPGDSSYPTDRNLWNHPPVVIERRIDALHKPFIGIHRQHEPIKRSPAGNTSAPRNGKRSPSRTQQRLADSSVAFFIET